MSATPPTRSLSSPLAAASTPRTIATGWKIAAFLLAAALAVASALYWPGLASMVQVWDRSGTYTHGFLILPISLYLLWRSRGEWLAVAPRPWWGILPWLLLVSLGWYAAAITELAGGQHATSVFMVMGLMAFFAGRHAMRWWGFPIAYLLFAIPFGEALLPPLMEFTADFTVAALQLVGVPVYREGLFFSVPSGNWSVVEACSGLRYLIASLALGTLYAYLSYRTPWKRLVFVLVSAVVPILANGFRAFMIVMIGHWSDMKLATGVDHYVYGWVFFTLVTFLLFWVGNRWREDTAPAASSADAEAAPGLSRPSPLPAGAWVLAWAAGLAAVSVGPLAARWTEARLHALQPAADFRPWEAFAADAQPFSAFKPHFTGQRQSWVREFRHDGQPLGLYVAHYVGQDAEHKLISSTNKLVPTTDLHWGLVSETRLAPDAALPERAESEIRGPRERLLAWHWYRVCGENTASPVWAKWLQLKCVATRVRDDATVFVLYTPVDDRREPARAVLQGFAARHGAALAQAVDARTQAAP